MQVFFWVCGAMNSVEICMIYVWFSAVRSDWRDPSNLITVMNVKVKVSLVHCLKSYRECSGTAPLIFHLRTKWRRNVSFRLRLKCDGTRTETRFRLSAKRTSPFQWAGWSVQSTTGRRAVHISLQGLCFSYKPVFCSHVTLTGYPLHSLVSSSLLLPCVTVCHHISKAVYNPNTLRPETAGRYPL